MRNKYKGRCENCGKEVLPKQGRWRMGAPFIKLTQNFKALRCMSCSTTTKKNMKNVVSANLTK